MKRILAFLLLIATLLPLSSCAADEEKNTRETVETKDKNETKKETEDDFEYPKISDTLTMEALENIPIAKSGMTEEELRQICLDYFYLQLTFAWTPSKNIKYTVKSTGSSVSLTRGTIYGGLPYVTDACGNLYRVFDFYDSKTGVITPPLRDQDFADIFGNQCSYGSYWAWSRVCNSTSYRYTNTIVAINGVIPVGPYTYDAEKVKKLSEYPTSQICKDNGKQTMFESYAALKPADGLVYYTTAGHVVMCASEPTVVYDDNGNIDGEKSFIRIMDQNGTWNASSQSDGTYYEVQGGIYTKKTFNKLFSSHYIPFTFAEFQGTDPIEEAEAHLSFKQDGTDLNSLKNSTLVTNYALSHVHVKVFDENGKEEYFTISRTTKINAFEHEMSSCIFPLSLEKFADGKHTIEITAFLGNGEKLTAYSGVLE